MQTSVIYEEGGCKLDITAHFCTIGTKVRERWHTNRQTDRRIDGRSEGQTDRMTEGPMEGWSDRQT